MAVNDLAPGYAKLFYTSAGRAHVQTLPCSYNPTTPTIGQEPVLDQQGGTTINAGAAISAWLTAVRAVFHSSTTFTAYEFYQKSVNSDPIFVYGQDLNIAGTSSTVNTPYAQAVLSFRTGAGNVMKTYLMEGAITVNQRIPNRISAAVPYGAVVTYLLGATNWIVGRDNAFPISGIYITTKFNDALRKKGLLGA